MPKDVRGVVLSEPMQVLWQIHALHTSFHGVWTPIEQFSKFIDVLESMNDTSYAALLSRAITAEVKLSDRK